MDAPASSGIGLGDVRDAHHLARLRLPDRVAHLPDDRDRSRPVRQHVRVLDRVRVGHAGDVPLLRAALPPADPRTRSRSRSPSLLLLYATTIPAGSTDPLVPALQNNLLLSVHVAVAIVAYGTFTVAFAGAVLYLIQTDQGRRGLPSRELLDEISYKAVMVGFPFLTLTIVLGAVWAERGLGHLLELGSQGDRVARDLAHLRLVPPRPGRPRLARPARRAAPASLASPRRSSPTSGTSSSAACTATAG